MTYKLFVNFGECWIDLCPFSGSCILTITHYLENPVELGSWYLASSLCPKCRWPDNVWQNSVNSWLNYIPFSTEAFCIDLWKNNLMNTLCGCHYIAFSYILYFTKTYGRYTKYDASRKAYILYPVPGICNHLSIESWFICLLFWSTDDLKVLHAKRITYMFMNHSRTQGEGCDHVKLV